MVIGKGLTTIGSDAFKGCNNLEKVEFHSKTVGAFLSGFTSIKEIIISNDVETIENSAFYGCSGLTTVEIPNSVTSIKNNVFNNCSGITSVTIGNGVNSVGMGAFNGCNNLKSVTIHKEIPISITSDFCYGRENMILFVPKGCKAAYKSSSIWKEFKEIVEIQPALRGDVNEDGVVNGTDIQAVINVIVEGEYDEKKGDVNEDGQVNGTDIQEVINIIVNAE